MGYYLNNGFDVKKAAVVQYYEKSSGVGLQFMAVNQGKDDKGVNNVDIVIPSGMTVWGLATKLATDLNGDGKIDNAEIMKAINNYKDLIKMNAQGKFNYGQHLTLQLDDAHLSQFSAYITNTYDPKDVLHNPPKKDDPGTSTFGKGDHYTKLANTKSGEMADSEAAYYDKFLTTDQQNLDDTNFVLDQSIYKNIIKGKNSDQLKTAINDPNSDINQQITKLTKQYNDLKDKIKNQWFGAKFNNWLNGCIDDKNLKDLKTKLAEANTTKQRMILALPVLQRQENLKMTVDTNNTDHKPQLESFKSLLEAAKGDDQAAAKVAKRKIRDLMLNRMFIANVGETKDDFSNLSDDDLVAKFEEVFSKYNPDKVSIDQTIYNTPTALTSMNRIKLPVTDETQADDLEKKALEELQQQ